VVKEDLDRVPRGADIDGLVDELVGHAVEVALELDVVVDVDPEADLPVGELIRSLGKKMSVASTPSAIPHLRFGVENATASRKANIEVLPEVSQGFESSIGEIHPQILARRQGIQPG
jgi:hypothetical protein